MLRICRLWWVVALLAVGCGALAATNGYNVALSGDAAQTWDYACVGVATLGTGLLSVLAAVGAWLRPGMPELERAMFAYLADPKAPHTLPNLLFALLDDVEDQQVWAAACEAWAISRAKGIAGNEGAGK